MAETRTEGLAAREAAAFLLTRIIDDKRNLDALTDSAHGLDRYLSLSDRDRSLVRAILTAALRHRRKIELALSKVMDRKPPRGARHLIHTLNVAATQILFLDVPDSAAVNLGVTAIAREKRSQRFKGLANAVLRRLAREKDKILEKAGDQVLPDWLFRQLRADYGKEKALAIGEMVAHEPVLDLTVKSDPAGWAQRLGGFILPTGTIRVDRKAAVDEMEGYNEGAWWVQDAASSLPARLLGEIKGKTVLELCAAPGGKTAQLASAGAKITALDNSNPRIKRLRQNLDRLGLKVQTVEADLLTWNPDQQFDAVLLDAPCSSTGTIRRHPDVMWTKSMEDVRELAKLQQAMVEKAVEFVAPGGILVFSNCSLLKEEGENLLAGLKEKLPLEFDPIRPEELPGLEACINGQGALRTLPHHLENADPRLGGMDGFFACRFSKAA